MCMISYVYDLLLTTHVRAPLATVADDPMRRTRSGLVNTSGEPRNHMATLKAVAAALQSASLPTGPLGQRRKREGSPGLMTVDTRKYVPEHQDLLEGIHKSEKSRIFENESPNFSKFSPSKRSGRPLDPPGSRPNHQSTMHCSAER